MKLRHGLKNKKTGLQKNAKAFLKLKHGLGAMRRKINDGRKEDVFKYVSKCDNVVKFSVEEPSLNEIFVAKVGESYEG